MTTAARRYAALEPLDAIVSRTWRILESVDANLENDVRACLSPDGEIGSIYGTLRLVESPADVKGGDVLQIVSIDGDADQDARLTHWPAKALTAIAFGGRVISTYDHEPIGLISEVLADHALGRGRLVLRRTDEQATEPAQLGKALKTLGDIGQLRMETVELLKTMTSRAQAEARIGADASARIEAAHLAADITRALGIENTNVDLSQVRIDDASKDRVRAIVHGADFDLALTHGIPAAKTLWPIVYAALSDHPGRPEPEERGPPEID